MILGNGNEGKQLNSNSKINSYISIDFGNTFKKLFDYPCVF